MANSPISRRPSAAADRYFAEKNLGVPFDWEAAPGRPKFQVAMAPSIYPLRPPPRLNTNTTPTPSPEFLPAHRPAPLKLKDFLMEMMPGVNKTRPYSPLVEGAAATLEEMNAAVIVELDDQSSESSETPSNQSPYNAPFSFRRSGSSGVSLDDGLSERYVHGRRASVNEMETSPYTSYDTATEYDPHHHLAGEPRTQVKAVPITGPGGETTPPLQLPPAWGVLSPDLYHHHSKLKLGDLLQKKLSDDRSSSQLVRASAARKTLGNRSRRFQLFLEKAEALMSEAEELVEAVVSKRVASKEEATAGWDEGAYLIKLGDAVEVGAEEEERGKRHGSSVCGRMKAFLKRGCLWCSNHPAAAAAAAATKSRLTSGT